MFAESKLYVMAPAIMLNSNFNSSPVSRLKIKMLILADYIHMFSIQSSGYYQSRSTSNSSFYANPLHVSTLVLLAFDASNNAIGLCPPTVICGLPREYALVFES